MANRQLDIFKKILFDLDKLYYDEGKGYASQDIMFLLRYVMSDRACKEKIFGELLQDYKEGILPEVVQEWDQLSNEVYESISQKHHFYCVMHVLAHFVENDNATINIAEQAHFDEKFLFMTVHYRRKDKVEL